MIDLACGTGHPTLVLGRSRSDLEIIGVDSTPAMIARARQKSAEESDHVRFEVMSLEARNHNAAF
ncbi:class I SAM-dependent methyltransferase [Arthrobacter sp. zg-Y40]|nr:class I SAM-dependent methyltransferase [Arthrobacter sp. zg-Y40]